MLVAATRRDGQVTCALLAKVGIECILCKDMRAVVDGVAAGVAVVVLTEAAFADRAFPELVAVLEAQPSWSEIPVLVFARESNRTLQQSEAMRALRNVIMMDLPSSARAVVSAVESALRSRQRQYQIRDQIVAQQQAQAALRDADRRKDEFLATLAHELRNPLAAICTALTLMERHPQRDAERPRMLAVMDRQSKLLIKLIDDLLDVSRIATGKMVLARENVDLREVVDAALETSRPIFEAARHALTVSSPDAPLHVLGDAQRLTQVVGNILRNAAKYTPHDGHVDLTLGQDEGRAWIRVRDDGIGIPEEMQGRVFDLFTQVNQSLERAQGGLGIGLSLVKKLAELHGGSVVVSSEGSGKGSTFTISLPLATGEASGRSAGGRGDVPSAGRELKVLVVDDNVDVADAFASLLTMDGHLTRTAHSGPEGLAAYEEFRPDVVFCDIGLPGMSGHEVARRLRSDRRNDATLLVAVTGWGNPDDRMKTKQAGFDVHLTKPVSVAEVDEILSTLG